MSLGPTIDRLLDKPPSPDLQRAIDRKMCEFIFGKRRPSTTPKKTPCQPSKN